MLTNGIEVVIGGKRLLTKNKGWDTFTSFNAYIAIHDVGAAILLTGLRVSNGKVLPPVKWNPKTKKFFNMAYTSKNVARAIAECIRQEWPDIEVEDGDSAWRSLAYDDKRITQLLPDMMAEAN